MTARRSRTARSTRSCLGRGSAGVRAILRSTLCAVGGGRGASRGSANLPPGPILVPCCGTFPELPELVAGHPEREIVGIDLSAAMVSMARERAARWPHVRVLEGDAATLDPGWSNSCAGVVSVFGLQQLPDPDIALANWVAALRPGGCLSVVFWPRKVEEEGPFAVLDQVLVDHRPPDKTPWESRLAKAVGAAGGTLERDEYLSFPMSHPDAEHLLGSVHKRRTTSQRWPSRVERRSCAVCVRTFLDLAPTGQWRHLPRARLIVARRPSGPA